MGETFRARDGLALWAEDLPAGRTPARAAVLIVHGYGEHGGRYGEIAARLAAAGFAVSSIDYRGHGRAGGTRGHCDRFGDFVGDLEAACARLRAQTQLPVALLAASHGALIALRALVEPGALPGVAAAVFVAPFLAVKLPVPAWKSALARALSRLIPKLSLPSGLNPDDFSHDAAKNQAYRDDPLTNKNATARWFTEMLQAQAYVAAHAAALAIPTLWMIAGDDRVVDSEQARRVFTAAGGDKQLLGFDDMFHELLNEVGREQIATQIEAWLTSRFPTESTRRA